MKLGWRTPRRRQRDPAATPAKEWTQERLDSWVGRVLSQVRVSGVSLVLDFWELDDDISAWLYADEFEVRDPEVGPVGRTSSEAVVALHALLGREVTSVELTESRLRLVFAQRAEVLVGPQQHQQAWALSFEQGGSITCEAGGALSLKFG